MNDVNMISRSSWVSLLSGLSKWRHL